jgi:very-short-patch-repair endonuclease
MRLKGNRLRGLHFRRQQIIEGYIVDFYCHGAALVVEVDGGVHLRQAAEDAYRDAVLKELGLKVLRVTDENVLADIEGVLARILDTIGTPLPLSGRGRGKG